MISQKGALGSTMVALAQDLLTAWFETITQLPRLTMSAFWPRGASSPKIKEISALDPPFWILILLLSIWPEVGLV